MRDRLIKLHNDLSTLSLNKLTYVKLELATNTLTYHQIGRVMSVPYISHLYLPLKFKVGILTPSGLSTMLTSLQNLIAIPDYDKLGVTLSISPMQLEFYRPFNDLKAIGPQRFEIVKLVSLTNKYYVKLVTTFNDEESKILYRSLIK